MPSQKFKPLGRLLEGDTDFDAGLWVTPGKVEKRRHTISIVGTGSELDVGHGLAPTEMKSSLPVLLILCGVNKTPIYPGFCYRSVSQRQRMSRTALEAVGSGQQAVVRVLKPEARGLMPEASLKGFLVRGWWFVVRGKRC